MPNATLSSSYRMEQYFRLEQEEMVQTKNAEAKQYFMLKLGETIQN